MLLCAFLFLIGSVISIPADWQNFDASRAGGVIPKWDCFGQPLCDYILLYITTTPQPPSLSVIPR